MCPRSMVELLEQAGEDAPTGVEFLGNLGVGITRVRGVHEPECGHLHLREQRHEEDDDSRLQALDAYYRTASGGAGKRTVTLQAITKRGRNYRPSPAVIH